MAAVKNDGYDEAGGVGLTITRLERKLPSVPIVLSRLVSLTRRKASTVVPDPDPKLIIMSATSSVGGELGGDELGPPFGSIVTVIG